MHCFSLYAVEKSVKVSILRTIMLELLLRQVVDFYRIEPLLNYRKHCRRLYLNTVQIAQKRPYRFECTPCSDAMNWVFDIKGPRLLLAEKLYIQVMYFQINGNGQHSQILFLFRLAYRFLASGT